MKTRRTVLSSLFLFNFAASCAVFPVRADDVKKTVPPGNFARKIAAGSLQDPSGASHTRQDAAGKVVVAIFSAPTMSQGGYQEKWSDLLADQPASKVDDSVLLALVEDMTQAGIFKGMALSDMKKQFTTGARPLVILDQNGTVFKQFGVPKNKTQILIYDKTSTLCDVEQNLNDVNGTVYRIQVITQELEKK
jgi:hypothetical protein